METRRGFQSRLEGHACGDAREARSGRDPGGLGAPFGGGTATASDIARCCAEAREFQGAAHVEVATSPGPSMCSPEIHDATAMRVTAPGGARR